MDSTGEHLPHVAVLAFPFGTHTAATYSLARKLAAAAPSATFSFLSTAKSNASLSRFAPSAPSNLRLYAVMDGRPEGFVRDPRKPVEEIELFFGAAPEGFRKGMGEAVKDNGGMRISCVVSDSFLWFAGELAGEMGVPSVQFWASATRCLLVHLYTDVLRRTIGTGDRVIPDRAEEKLHFIPALSILQVRDLPEGVVSGDLNSLFARALYQVAEEVPRAAAVVLSTFEGLEPAADAELKAKLNKCFSVGPLELAEPAAPQPDESGCLSWLDRQVPAAVVYVCFGSGIMSPPPAELADLAEGLEASGAPFLWSLGENVRGHLPAGFLDRTGGRGFVVSWAPQPRVLAHAAVGAFVTHCGWNSVMESITRGVPMICRPLLGDQRVIARAVSDEWVVGVRMDGDAFAKDRVVGALHVVMKTEEGRRMRERARGLGEAAMQAVGPGGSSGENLRSLVEIICGC